MACKAHNRFGEWPGRLAIALHSIHKPSMGWADNKNKWTFILGIGKFRKGMYWFKYVFNHLIDDWQAIIIYHVMVN
jgi:hypothetical protein